MSNVHRHIEEMVCLSRHYSSGELSRWSSPVLRRGQGNLHGVCGWLCHHQYVCRWQHCGGQLFLKFWLRHFPLDSRGRGGTDRHKNQSLQVYISRDGKTIVSGVPDSSGNLNAAIWQGGRNLKIIPPIAGAVVDDVTHTLSNATGVSGDGSILVGYVYIAQNKIVAFRWDAVKGMASLGTFGRGDLVDSQPLSISGDGRSIVGWDLLFNFSPAGPGGPAMNSRRGAIWWEGHERLLHPFGWAGEAWVTNDVGSIVAGQFHRLHGASTYLWTAWDGHFEDLGAVTIPLGGDQAEYISQPYAMSDDGSVVGGESGRTQKFAMMWTHVWFTSVTS